MKRAKVKDIERFQLGDLIPIYHPWGYIREATKLPFRGKNLGWTVVSVDRKNGTVTLSAKGFDKDEDI